MSIVACQGNGVFSETAVQRTDKTNLPFSRLRILARYEAQNRSLRSYLSELVGEIIMTNHDMS